MTSSGRILEIDMGNTRIKWRLLQGGRLSDRGSAAWAAADQQGNLWETIAPKVDRLDRVRIASVAGETRDQALQQWVQKRWQLSPEFALTAAASAGVVNSYRDATRMGVDRWLAIAAAYRRAGSACLVVDCGSAVTIELVGGNGHHLGGYIVPGLRLMRRALFDDTDAVKVSDRSLPQVLAPGRDTQSAVTNGLALMVVGLIDQSMGQLCEQESEAQAPPARIFVTGGDAEALIPHLRDRLNLAAEYVPDLVLDGLALVLP